MERVSNRTIGWFVGDRSSATFKKFFASFEHLEATFYTDAWSAYSEVLPNERHIIGKQYTFGIEQSNSNIRHFIGRFARRKK